MLHILIQHLYFSSPQQPQELRFIQDRHTQALCLGVLAPWIGAGHYVVFLLTLLVTLAPTSWAMVWAVARSKVGRVPVNTMVFP